MAAGFMEAILRIDLSNSSFKTVPYPDEWKRKYLGGTGVAARIIYDEVPPEIEAFDPRNILCIFNGPWSGSPAPMSGRYGVACKSPLSGGWGEATASGFWAPELKAAGLDGIVIKGKAEKPVYIWIEDGRVELLPADDLWGKTTIETDHILREKYGAKSKVLSIGPSGERLVRYACVISDEGRAAGRCGVGAVMGSKNLKAVVVRGTQKVPIGSPEKLERFRKKYSKELAESPGGQNMSGGTCHAVLYSALVGDFPVRNWSLSLFQEGAEKLDGSGDYTKIFKKKWPCYRCPVACGRWVKLEKEVAGVKPFEGHGPEYETLGAFGGALMNPDIETVVAANWLCNAYGLDTISGGGMVAFAFECYENNILTKEDVGFELKWGDGNAAVKLLKMIAEREGIGKLLGEGPIIASKQLGKGADKFALHVKGLYVPAHDPRVWNVVGGEYAISNRGACHLQGFTETWQSIESIYAPAAGAGPDDFQYFGTKWGERQDSRGKGKPLAISMAACNTTDALITCKFFSIGLPFGNEMADLAGAIMGRDITVEELLKTGERLIDLKRAFNLRCGLTKADDKLPERLMTPAPDSELHVAPDVELILKDFYEYMDWDWESGKPNKKRLIDLGLEDVANDLWPNI